MDVALIRAAGSEGCWCCPSFLPSSPAPSRATSSACSSSSSTPGNNNSSCWFLRRNDHLELPGRVPFCKKSAHDCISQRQSMASLLSHTNSRNRTGTGDFAVSGHCSRTRCLPFSASSEEVAGVPLEEQEGAESSSRTRSNETEEGEEKVKKKKNSKTSQSSWDAKDSEGKDYLYRLGKEADNLNVTVGARSGLIDEIFIGDFLGKDADIVFDYRQKVTRSFQNLQEDFYIAPAFLEKVVTHITKNYLASSLDTQVSLLLGIWGGKGQGKSFQLELICKALGMEPVIMSAGELESEWAGEPGKLIPTGIALHQRLSKLRER